MLDPTLSRARQQKLLRAHPDLDVLVLTAPQHVYYLTAHLAKWQHRPGLVLARDKAILISANQPAKNVAADDVCHYSANLYATLRQDQARYVAGMIDDVLGDAKRVGFDTSATAAALLARGGRSYTCIDETFWQHRRVKDADELALMRRAIDATRVMYETARRVIEPGISEIDVFNALAAAAVAELGEPMTALLGNDFACGVGGGPPRPRRIEAGELYVLDLGPAYRGYFADNARVIRVDRKPTDAQLKAHAAITDVFPIVESMAKPGASCRAIYAAIDAHFQEQFGRPQHHHLGHGVGLEPHEFPHLNPNWDDTLIEGDIFTCEPGIYAGELRGGLRIENQYRVTAESVENLTPFPLILT